MTRARNGVSINIKLILTFIINLLKMSTPPPLSFEKHEFQVHHNISHKKYSSCCIKRIPVLYSHTSD